MTATEMQSTSNTPTSQKAKPNRAWYVLLAKVGTLTRKVSQLRAEVIHYYSFATEALAICAELSRVAECLRLGQGSVDSTTKIVILESRLNLLTKQALSFWPQGTESQKRALSMLDSDGLAMLAGVTDDGYLCLSMDRILSNVELAIEVTKESDQKLSSKCELMPTSAAVGIAG